MIKETVDSTLRDVVEYLPPSPDYPNIHPAHIEADYQLTFMFTAGYGNASTFGKDKKSFHDQYMYIVIHFSILQ